MSQINKEIIISYIAASCLYANIPPYIMWHSNFMHLLAVLFAVICLMYSIIKGYKNGYIGILFFIVYLMYCIRLDNNIVGLIRNMCIVSIFFIKKEFVLNILKAFKNIYGIFLLLGLISYLIVKFTPIDLPYTIIDPLNSLKNYNYLQYPFFVEDNFFSDLNYRFFAQFDEPGVVGTLCGILLFADNFNIKKWTNIVFLISGIFSFSLFFYILALVYIFIHASVKHKIQITVILLIIGILLYTNEIVYELVFRRFEVENGNWIGDNRSGYEFDRFYEKFRFSSDYFFGMDNSSILKLNEGGSTYKQIVVQHGAIFLFMYVVCFFAVARKYFRNHSLLYIKLAVILLGTIYQRPMIANYAYVFLLYSSIFQIAVNSNKISIK